LFNDTVSILPRSSYVYDSSLLSFSNDSTNDVVLLFPKSR
jgi:hypothetical protein